MPSTETVTCDPATFIANRAELGLDDIGLAIRGEPDWGDSEHELFLIRQALGEVPADRHPPNRNVQLQLMVMQEGAVNLAEAASKLQKKVGLWQREGGFVRRDFDASGGFSTSVAQQVYGAALGGLQGWMFAHRKKAPDVTLNLVTGPYVYGTTAVESATFKSEGLPHLKWEIESVKGSAPGLVRVTVKNEDASDWKGLLHSIESRYLAPVETRTTTADAFYECEKLTLSGGSFKEGSAGSSGASRVQVKLTAGFINVLSSKIPTAGHMTHTGVRRVWLRAQDFGAVAENIELKLEWRALGSSRWTANRPVRIPVGSSEFSKIDLGEARLETAILGEQRWEWRLLARARSGTGEIGLDCMFFLTTEQFLALSTPSATQIADFQSEKPPTKVEDIAGGGEGAAWTNPENAKASDNVYATLKGGAFSSHQLKATGFGFAIPVGATITAVVVSIEKKFSGLTTGSITDKVVQLVKGGVVSGTNKASIGHVWNTVDEVVNYGYDLWGLTLTPADVNAANFGVVLGIEQLQLEGKECIASVDQIKITVYYTEAVDENRVCFAGRSIELRSDGVYRQHITDEVWARGVPDGFLPYAPPSGLEGRAARGIIVPSKGDHLAQGDAGMHKLSAVVRYFPGYHFTSEAK
jgi:hypothetical protein